MLTVHSRPESDAWRSSWIDGSATFTTVLSSMIMKRAKHIAASVHQRRLPSFRRMPCVNGPSSFAAARARPEAPPPRGDRDELGAAVAGVLDPADLPPLDQHVHGAAGGRERENQVIGERREGDRVRVVEDPEDLHLAERQARRVDGAE